MCGSASRALPLDVAAKRKWLPEAKSEKKLQRKKTGSKWDIPGFYMKFTCSTGKGELQVANSVQKTGRPQTATNGFVQVGSTLHTGVRRGRKTSRRHSRQASCRSKTREAKLDKADAIAPRWIGRCIVIDQLLRVSCQQGSCRSRPPGRAFETKKKIAAEGTRQGMGLHDEVRQGDMPIQE